MKISFIVTSYNIADYIERCLKSVSAVAKAGDEIIIIDDGSTDATCDMIKAFVSSVVEGANVDVKPVFLGQNTVGGVGIAGNIGLEMAQRDCVFFVDGDDWIDSTGFEAARREFRFSRADILIANYKEFDEKNTAYKDPADERRWCRLRPQATGIDSQLQALKMIAVPWRKFYRREFLEIHNLRFPEGDFFFEDNPFHWAVCLKAKTIAYLDVVLCYHRVNRPGQTMASTGSELKAFFEHYETIQGYLVSDSQDALKKQAISWLLSNMSWHFQKLQPKVVAFYLQRAEGVLGQMSTHLLADVIEGEYRETQIDLYVQLLLQRGWGAAFEYFVFEKQRQESMELERTVSLRCAQMQSILCDIKSDISILRNVEEYAMIKEEQKDLLLS